MENLIQFSILENKAELENMILILLLILVIVFI